MGIAIGIGCIVRDVIKVKDIQEVVASMPTLIFVILGGCIGGTLSVIVKKDMKSSEENVEITNTNNESNLDTKLNGNKNGVGYGN
jgi:phosphate/sulfate permease